ncbi:hypothetical protein AVEN_165908-1 [Araneus ventricosus]|uniref:Uncharacterized protein n=1 Tax=Araneus ventricosus TaxID=182803 RepID=A0A4Y2A2W1_ARAVE|nr:hypothetical protein AVEN_111891-1 [Araneus ventricosus]GBL74061.1 hypothetical protein AVEN_165908-1 [Araneus ventricosus]
MREPRKIKPDSFRRKLFLSDILLKTVGLLGGKYLIICYKIQTSYLLSATSMAIGRPSWAASFQTDEEAKLAIIIGDRDLREGYPKTHCTL